MPDTQANRTTVFGIYSSYQDMERGIDLLKGEGFRNTDISVLLPENVGPKPLTQVKRNRAERAAAGGFSGALVGGTLGWLAGIGVIAIPGFGPLLAAGPILAALAGVGVGGTVAGVAGALIGTGIPATEAAKYERQLKKGAIMISVNADPSSAQRARQVLLSTGAGDITLANRRSFQSAK
ncbi:MAG: DUF3341 domain-containing protein [Candidatus Acidiferrales bacterium]